MTTYPVVYDYLRSDQTVKYIAHVTLDFVVTAIGAELTSCCTSDAFEPPTWLAVADVAASCCCCCMSLQGAETRPAIATAAPVLVALEG